MLSDRPTQVSIPDAAVIKTGAFPDAAMTKTGALLLKAFETNAFDQLFWSEIRIGDLLITVASDAAKAKLGDRAGVRLPVSYAETIQICRRLGCVAPSQAIADAMYAQAKAKLVCRGLVTSEAYAKLLTSADFTLKTHEHIERQLAGKGLADGDLRFGAWKLWLVHPLLARMGAVNHGFWDASGKPIQVTGARHDASHYDYSQLLQPVQRFARRAGSGEPVDLLDVYAREGVPSRFLDPYRNPADMPLMA